MRCATAERRGPSIAAALLLVLTGCDERQPADAGATGLRFLSGAADTGAFAIADSVREFEFPRDHGVHEQFATEWWYFTGNLQTEAARHFGFELTFFRYALSGAAPERASAWASNQVWLAHLTLTDTLEERFVSDARVGRGALGIAGASPERLRVHVRDWSAERDPLTEQIRLKAESDEFAISLQLAEAAPIALHGDRGLDRKGAAAGNASYYYSIPRLNATGSVRLSDSPPLQVSGTAWLDREWATSSLDDGIVGWDWFGLQLDGGTSLMLYRLRSSDGSSSPFSTGTVMYADGRTIGLDAGDVGYTVVDQWRSPDTRVTYPVEWEVAIRSLDAKLQVQPRLRHQEFNRGLRYWEGAVVVSGTFEGRQTRGAGYLELAGYLP